jgi:hypothetical protein
MNRIRDSTGREAGSVGGTRGLAAGAESGTKRPAASFFRVCFSPQTKGTAHRGRHGAEVRGDRRERQWVLENVLEISRSPADTCQKRGVCTLASWACMHGFGSSAMLLHLVLVLLNPPERASDPFRTTSKMSGERKDKCLVRVRLSRHPVQELGRGEAKNLGFLRHRIHGGQPRTVTGGMVRRHCRVTFRAHSPVERGPSGSRLAPFLESSCSTLWCFFTSA